MTWVYDKEQLMWRRDLNVRVIFSPLRGWIAVNSMQDRLPHDYADADTAKAAADKAWPTNAPPAPDGETYIWPPPKKRR